MSNEPLFEVTIADPKFAKMRALTIGGVWHGVRQNGRIFKLTQTQFDMANAEGNRIVKIEETDDNQEPETEESENVLPKQYDDKPDPNQNSGDQDVGQ